MRVGKRLKAALSGNTAHLFLSVLIALSASVVSAKLRVTDGTPIPDVGVPAEPSRVRLNILINMPTRPTIADIERVLNPWPEQNPFTNISNTRGGQPAGQLLRIVSVDAPKIIAELEKAFPGGTYAFLGRDSAFLGDVVDAFYRAHGQNNRVVHLNASGGSMTGQNQDLVDFLAGNGLRVETIDTDPPFIIIDRTSYRLGASQSRIYLQAFYEAYAKATGASVNHLARKMNVISTANANPIVPGFDVAQFLSQQERVTDLNGPPQIMTIHGSLLTDQTEWHQTFGRFQRQGKSVTAPPGAVHGVQNSESILSILYDVINMTRSEQFYRDVQANAKALGYEFPEGRVRERTDLRMMTDEELAKEIVESAQAKYAEAIDGLEKVGEDKEPLSDNGAKLYQQIKDSNILKYTGREMPMLGSSEIVLMFLAGTVHAYEQKKISSRDLRRIVKRILAFYPSFLPEQNVIKETEQDVIRNNEVFAKGVAQLYAESVTFHHMWDTKSDYFLNNEHKAGKNGPLSYRAIDQFIKGQKNCAAVLDGARAS